MEVLGGNGYVEEGPMARIYRQMPLNSIWEGSGNVMCLDVLRAIAKHPSCLDALAAEVAPALGRQAARRVRGPISRTLLRQPTISRDERRQVAQAIAALVQGALLVRFAPDFVADAYCASRLGPSIFGGGAFGNLPAGTDVAAILERAWPT